MATETKPAAAPAGFRFPLPIDPIRLAAGAAARWPVLILCGSLGAALGAVAGFFLTKPSYSVSASLIKRKVPQNVQASETGQAYRPADLNDPTLLATLLAAEPLEKAVARRSSGLNARSARKMVEASQQKGTDIYFVTYHSPYSPEDAVQFTRIWAEEITEYTKRLQQSDARGVRDILQREVADMEKRLSSINREILDFSREKQFLGADGQVTAALNQLGQVSLELENARSDLKATDAKIEALVAELRRQSPIDSQLKTAREELAALRATYTDENPLVKAKLQSIAYLEENLRKFQEQGPASLEYYTGTPIGNQLFLDILSLKNERTGMAGKVDSHTELQRSLEERIKEYPAIVSRYQELEKLRERTVASLTLLGNRLKETEIFASSAPGYWQIFEGPEDHEITPASKLKLPLAFGAAGGVAGVGLSLGLLLLLTSRASRRSVLECCAATRAPLLTGYYAEAPDEEAIDALWLSDLSGRLQRGETLLTWSPLCRPEDERNFWTQLAAAAARDGASLPPVVDLTPDGLWGEVSLPAGLLWRESGDPSNRWLRASKLPETPGRERLKQVRFWIALASGEAASLKPAARIRGLIASHLTAPGGTVAVLPRPASAIRRAGDRISHFVASHFSRTTPADPQHE